MQATLEFNPELYTEKQLKVILSIAQREKCTPAEAVGKALDEVANRTLRKGAKAVR